MAGATVSDQQARCKGCASYQRVNLTHERCALHGLLVLGEDTACSDHMSGKPWLAWGRNSGYVGRAARV